MDFQPIYLPILSDAMEKQIDSKRRTVTAASILHKFSIGVTVFFRFTHMGDG